MIHELALRCRNKPLGSVTTSFGVTGRPDHAVATDAPQQAGDTTP